MLSKIKGFGKSILNGIKGIFGIHSPSTVFRDEIGSNLAKGIGVGFTSEMKDVNSMIQNSLPTDFDLASNVNISKNITNDNNSVPSSSRMSSFDTSLIVDAFKDALSEMKVELDGHEMGNFVENTVIQGVYS